MHTGYLGIRHKAYSIVGLDGSEQILQRTLWSNATLEWVSIQLSPSEYVQEEAFLESSLDKQWMFHANAGARQPIFRDDAAKGLSYIFRLAREEARHVFLSGHGPDDHMSFYNMPEKFPLPLFSTGAVLDNFPHPRFTGHSLRGAIDREEYIGGAHGIEARYPFLDRAVVQEFLWLAPDLKNSFYKKPVADHLAGPRCAGYPWSLQKLLFSVGTAARFFVPSLEVRRSPGGPSGCWSKEFSRPACCDDQWGPEGNAACWYFPYTHALCCAQGLRLVQRTEIAGAGERGAPVIPDPRGAAAPDAPPWWQDAASWQAPRLLGLDTFMRYAALRQPQTDEEAAGNDAFMQGFQLYASYRARRVGDGSEGDVKKMELMLENFESAAALVPLAAAAAGGLYLAKGDTERAGPLLATAAAGGHHVGAYNHAQLLRDGGRLEDAEEVVRQMHRTWDCEMWASSWNHMCKYKMMFDRRPVLKHFANKLTVKSYVEAKGGFHTARLLAWTRDPAELSSILPTLSNMSFLVKASWGSGFNIFVNHLATPMESVFEGNPKEVGTGRDWGVPEIVARATRWFGTFYNSQEWAYVTEHRFVLVEEMLDIPGHIDYKFYCYSGDCQLIQVNTPSTGHEFHMDFYTPGWVRLNVTLRPHPPGQATLPRPRLLEEMSRLAVVLAEGLDYCRVDLYELETGAGPGVGFGELTHYPHACEKEWVPSAFDRAQGQAWRADYGVCAGSEAFRQPRPPVDLSRFAA